MAFKKNGLTGLAMSLATAILWGVMPLALRGLMNYLDPLTASGYRYFLCVIGNVAYLTLFGSASWKHLRERRTLILLGISLTGLVINNVLYMYGLRLTNPGTAQVISQLGPVMLLLGGVLIFREAFSRQQWFGVVLVVGGLLLFCHDRLDAVRDLDRYGLGILILTIATVFWAAYGLAQKKMVGQLGPQQVLLIVYGVGAMVQLPLASPSEIVAMSFNGHLFAIGCMLITVTSYATFGEALARWDASRVSAVLALMPLFTLLATEIVAVLKPGLFISEQHDALSWVGAATVVAGSLCVAVPRPWRRLKP